jgi:hypothetical protein
MVSRYVGSGFSRALAGLLLCNPTEVGRHVQEAGHYVRVFTLALALLTAACGSVPPLANTRGSAAELATAVLEGFERRDRSGLRALAVTEQEFRDHVWPELPAARPERNLPFSYVWGDLQMKSEYALGQSLENHGGQPLELMAVTPRGETTQYKGYVVHREAELTVKDSAGRIRELRLFGSILEKDGRFKVFSYVVD